MTFCLGITVEDGLVAIADTRIMAGNKLTTVKKKNRPRQTAVNGPSG